VYEVNSIKKVSNFLHWLFEKIIDKLSFRRFVIDHKYDMLNLTETAPYLNLKKLFAVIGTKPDLIILNWISGFINSRDIKTLYNKYKIPFIWILHDYAPLTGGCHVAWNCNGFIDFCGNCPGLNSSFEKDKTNHILMRKLKNLSDIPVFTTGWSDYILNKSHHSRLFKNRTLITISPFIDSTLFCPSENKELSKKKLNIPHKNKVILFGAQNVFSEYKGIKHLILALAELNKYLLSGIDFNLVTFGKANEEILTPINLPWISLGMMDNPSLAYQAADVFVAPTLQDTGPMTVCESLMCGIPVVGYPMGIIPDVITENETGCIVAEGNIELLAEKIASILNLSKQEYQKISGNCREIALEKFSEDAQMQSFRNLFDLLKLDQVSELEYDNH
ncbi:MAG TPA: glycosyltransferase, partial [Ignavibacteria bacterium]